MYPNPPSARGSVGRRLYEIRDLKPGFARAWDKALAAYDEGEFTGDYRAQQAAAEIQAIVQRARVELDRERRWPIRQLRRLRPEA